MGSSSPNPAHRELLELVGAGAELEQAHIITLRDRETVRAESYLDRAKARKAAGLSE